MVVSSNAMSFWISAYAIDLATSTRKAVDVPSNAGGFASWGEEVYGSPLAVELGLTILPRLASDGGLEVEGNDIQRLRDEAALLHSHAHRLCPEPTLNRTDPDGTRHNVMLGRTENDVVAAVRTRLENIIAAADIALALGPGRGSVSIS